MQEALNTVTANPRIQKPYPHVSIETLTEAITVVISMLKSGDLPVIVHYGGRTYKVADVDRSPTNLAMLLRIVDFKIVLNDNESINIHSNSDLLERGTCLWTD